mgnify:CR=1 FL=1
MSGMYGMNIKMAIYGESHGASIGLVIDGVPPGLKLDLEAIEKEMARRAPGKNQLSTQRKESDSFAIQSGFFEGYTTGTPLCVVIKNSDQHSKDYSILKDKMRPGHADYAGFVRYQGFNDYRGGGHFSGRLTAPLVFIGAVAKQALAQEGILVGAHILQIADIKEEIKKIEKEYGTTYKHTSEEIEKAIEKTLCYVRSLLYTTKKENPYDISSTEFFENRRTVCFF